MKSIISPVFSETISYSNLKVNLKGIERENTISMLNSNKNIKFAVVRRDLLWGLKKQNEPSKKYSYITLGVLPYKAQLTLLHNEKEFDKDLDMLVSKTIAIGLLSDIIGVYIKELLDINGIKYQVFYKSLTNKESLQNLYEGNTDVYFRFLPINFKIDNVYKQTLFSKRFSSYFEEQGVFEIDYNGIFSPYVIVASTRATDEEIENIIFRLIEKDMFMPITDTRYGMINQYVVTHLESIKAEFNRKHTYKKKQINDKYFKNVCRKYHYGFLKLLREKPKIKKRLKKIKDSQKKKEYIKQINKVLLDIDAQKNKCSLEYLERKKKLFIEIKESIL